MTSVGYATPTEDSGAGDIDLDTADADNGWITLNLSRSLDTGDDNDYVMPLDTEFPVSWALHTTSNDITQYHDQRGSFTVYLNSTTTDTDNGGGDSDDNTGDDTTTPDVPGGASDLFSASKVLLLATFSALTLF